MTDVVNLMDEFDEDVQLAVAAAAVAGSSVTVVTHSIHKNLNDMKTESWKPSRTLYDSTDEACCQRATADQNHHHHHCWSLPQNIKRNIPGNEHLI